MNLLAFAFGAGVLATVNPCGFAMLPAFFGLSIGAAPADTRDQPGIPVAGRIAKGLGVGLAVSAGFTAVFTVIGVLVALGLRQLAQAVPVAAVLVGAVLTLVGLATLLGRPLDLARLRPGSHPTPGRTASRGVRRMVAFGAGYAVASLSCTLGVLLAVVAQATATGQPAQTIAVFAAYATGAATILISVAIATALAHAGLATSIRKAMPAVSRIGGALLALSGLYLVIYWWPAITGDPPSTGMGRLTDRLSGQVSQVIDAHPALLVAVAGGLLIAAIGAAATQRRRSTSNTPAPSAEPGDDHDCGCDPVSARQHTDGSVS
jgi:cytochrome c-type biogenesis protein